MARLVGHKVYLDTNTVIYALDGQAQYRNLQGGLLDHLDTGVLTAVTSELTIVETLVGPRRNGDIKAEKAFRTFLTPSPTLTVAPISMDILDKVIELRSQFAIKIPDAIHIATGILSNCTVFLTGDQAWSKTGITTINPLDVS